MHLHLKWTNERLTREGLQTDGGWDSLGTKRSWWLASLGPEKKPRSLRDLGFFSFAQAASRPSP